MFNSSLLLGSVMFSDVAGENFGGYWFDCPALAGCRRRAFHPTRICQARKPASRARYRGTWLGCRTIPVAAGESAAAAVHSCELDLFNHGYYWEAHEAWEGLWQVADRGDPLRMLFKGLILLSAAGVEIRGHKNAAAARHAMRAAAMLRLLMKVPHSAFERALGMSPAALAECAEMATRIPAELQATAPDSLNPCSISFWDQVPAGESQRIAKEESRSPVTRLRIRHRHSVRGHRLRFSPCDPSGVASFETSGAESKPESHCFLRRQCFLE